MIQESLRRHRRRKRMVRGILVAVVLSAAIATVLFFSMDLTEFSVTGNTYLTQDTVVSLLFDSRMDRRTFYARWKNALGEKEEIPMIQSYRMIFEGLHQVTVEITEKPIVGGISYVDSFLYFDSGGYILCSTKEALPGIPLIEGIVIRQPMLYRQIQTDREGGFASVLETASLIRDNGLSVTSLIFDEEDHITLVVGNIRVQLGDSGHMEEKLAELSDILAQGSLETLSGTLYLDSCGDPNSTGSYIFKRD